MSKKVKASLAAMPAPDDKYELDRHMQTLMDAHELMGDDAKMKKVHAHMKKKMKGMKSVQDLKDAYQEKFSKGAASTPEEPDADDNE